MNSKRRRVDGAYTYPADKTSPPKRTSDPASKREHASKRTLDHVTQDKRKEKFSFATHDRQREEKTYYGNNGSAAQEDVPRAVPMATARAVPITTAALDERPIQSQDLSSSSTDLSNTESKK